MNMKEIMDREIAKAERMERDRHGREALKGDRCDALSGDGFSCDSFMLNSTQTDLDQNADGGGIGKTYIAAVTGRITDKER